MSAQTPPCRPRKLTRTVWWAAGLAVITAIVYLMATASTGPVDPTEATAPQSHATVVFNSAIIVFREGLEAVDRRKDAPCRARQASGRERLPPEAALEQLHLRAECPYVAVVHACYSA